MAISIKRPLQASCHPKGEFILFYISVKRPRRFELSVRQEKRMVSRQVEPKKLTVS